MSAWVFGMLGVTAIAAPSDGQVAVSPPLDLRCMNGRWQRSYSEALQRVQTATTLRIRNGKLSAIDGPFAETEEQLGGFILIDARDLDEAIQVASKIPPLRLGTIEVRPVWNPVDISTTQTAAPSSTWRMPIILGRQRGRVRPSVIMRRRLQTRFSRCRISSAKI